jgi:hypothetical protein
VLVAGDAPSLRSTPFFSFLNLVYETEENLMNDLGRIFQHFPGFKT